MHKYFENVGRSYLRQKLWHVFLVCFFIKNGPTTASFSFIFGLFKQTIQFLQQINVKNVMFIQYPAPGFEPMTFGT